MSDLAICKHMGWSYDDVLALPVDVYAVLIEELNALAAAANEG